MFGTDDVLDCLNSFTELESLSGSELYHCTNCKGMRNATKKLSLNRVPPVKKKSITHPLNHILLVFNIILFVLLGGTK